MATIRKRVQADASLVSSDGNQPINQTNNHHSSSSTNNQSIRDLWRLPFYHRDPTHSQLVYLLVAFFYIYIAYFVVYHDSQLPTPKPSSILPAEYSEVRAREHLYAMSANGIRNTGEAANEVYAARYIVSQLSRIRSELKPGFVLDIDIQRPSGCFDLDFLGGFTSSYQNVTNILARLHYVGPHDKTNRTDVAFLISAHFDSAFSSPAASDDLANIASMLEIVRNLANLPPLPHAVIFNFNGAEESILQAAHGFITQHPWAESIAAFMNAEGAGGAGRELTFQLGPSNAWLAFLYARSVPYPFASSVAQDIFSSGIIPSDTDFRIYRDFGGLAGIDMAYITDGWIYHTPLDDVAHVPAGSMQRAGENVLALSVAIASSPQLFYAHPRNRHLCMHQPQIYRSLMERVSIRSIEYVSVRRNEASDAHHKALDERVDSQSLFGDAESLKKGDPFTHSDDEEEGYVCDTNDFSRNAIFFDLVGNGAVIYSSYTARYVNALALIAALFYLIYQHTTNPFVTYFRTASSLLLLVAGWVASLAASAAIAGLFLVTGQSMKWFSHPILVVGLYCIPTVLVSYSIQKDLAAPLLFRSFYEAAAGKKTDVRDANQPIAQSENVVTAWVLEEQCFLTTLTLWVILLPITMYYDVSSGFVFCLMILLPLTGRVAGKLLDRFVVATNSPHQQTNNHQHGSWMFLSLYLLSIMLPSVLLVYAWYVVGYFFMPVMGRAGDQVASELVIGILVSIATLVCTTISLSLAHLDKGFLLRKPLIIAIVTTIAVAMFLPAYNSTHPKRTILNQTTRHWHPSYRVSDRSTSEAVNITSVAREDSVVWFNGLDWLGVEPLRNVRLNRAVQFGFDENGLRDAEEIQCTGIYCDMPFIYPFKDFMHGWRVLPAPMLPERYHGILTLDRVEMINSTQDQHRRRYHFTSIGSHHQTLFINNIEADESGAELLKWSFHDPDAVSPAHRVIPADLSSDVPSQTERPASLGPFYDLETPKEKAKRREYFVYFSSGTPDLVPDVSHADKHPAYHFEAPIPTLPDDLEPLMPTLHTLAPYNERRWSFWLEVRDNPTLKSDPNTAMPLKLAISSHYLGESTPLLNSFVEDMPNWTAVVHWIADWNGYEFT